MIHPHPGVFGLERVGEGRAGQDGHHLVVHRRLAGVEVDPVRHLALVDEVRPDGVAELHPNGGAGDRPPERPGMDDVARSDRHVLLDDRHVDVVLGSGHEGRGVRVEDGVRGRRRIRQPGSPPGRRRPCPASRPAPGWPPRQVPRWPRAAGLWCRRGRGRTARCAPSTHRCRAVADRGRGRGVRPLRSPRATAARQGRGQREGEAGPCPGSIYRSVLSGAAPWGAASWAMVLARTSTKAARASAQAQWRRDPGSLSCGPFPVAQPS